MELRVNKIISTTGAKGEIANGKLEDISKYLTELSNMSAFTGNRIIEKFLAIMAPWMGFLPELTEH